VTPQGLHGEGEARVVDAHAHELKLGGRGRHEVPREQRPDAVFEPTLERARPVGGAEGLGHHAVEHGGRRL
jgi:hypothetical protein